MTISSKPETPEQITDRELGSDIDAFIGKVHRTIQKARRKMTPEQRQKADRNANAILEDASVAAKRSRRRA